ncbi:MAG: tetratricopeptide repeat protein [Bacteroidota bacterium]
MIRLFQRSSFRVTIILVSGLIFCKSQSNAQSIQIDSLQTLLTDMPGDTTRVNTLIELAFEYRVIKAEEMLSYALEAETLAQTLGFDKGVAQATRNIGLAHKYLGNYDSAIYFSTEALRLASEIDLLQIQADALNTMSTTYMATSRYDEAISALQSAIGIFEKIDNRLGLAASYGNLGVIYKDKGQYAKALSYYQRATHVYDSLEIWGGVANTYHNIATVYQEELDFDTALDYYKKTSKYDSITGNVGGRAHTQLNIGNVLVTLGKPLEAKRYYFQSVELGNQSGSKCMTSLPLTQLGELYLENNQLDSAEYFIRQSLSIALPCKNSNNISSTYHDYGRFFLKKKDFNQAKYQFLKGYEVATADSLKPKMEVLAEGLYQTLEQLGDYKNALKYLAISTQLNNELFNQQNSLKIARLEANFEFTKEKELLAEEAYRQRLIYEQELQRQRWLIYSAVGAAVLLVIISVLIYRSNVRKKRDNQLLSFKNETIEAKNEELSAKNEELSALREKDYANQQQEKKLLRETIHLKERELAGTAMINHEKNKILSTIEKELNRINPLMNESLKVELKSLKKLVTSNIDHSASWDSFIHQFSQVHPIFFENLKEAYPSLSVNDLKLCAYIKVGMNNKEIAGATNTALSTVKKNINRLKKKIELSAEESVRDYLIRYV